MYLFLSMERSLWVRPPSHSRLEFLSLELASFTVGRVFKMDLNGVIVVSSLAVLLITIIYWRIKKAYGFFAKQGIPGPEPAFPLGTWTKSARLSVGNEDKQLIHKHGSLVGTFDGLIPNLLVAEWETVVKKILSTDAAKFRSRRAEESKNKALKSVLRIWGNDSQNDASSVLNTVINRKKLGKLIPRLAAAANEFTRSVAKQEKVWPVNDAVNDFVYDATALVLLGVDLNADPIYRQAFIKNCENVCPGVACSSALAIIPYVYGNIDNAISTKSSIEYFRNLIATQLMERPEETDHASKSADFVDLLLQLSRDEEKIAKKEKEQEQVEDCLILSKQVLCDQVLAAVLTFNYWMRNTLLFSIYALARNQNVQEKLFEEVEKIVGSEKLNDEIIGKLLYLDGFVKEVQRMYPVEARLEKIAAEDFDVSETTKIKKGTKVSIPIFAMHTSKQYHPDPKAFNPTRFASADYEVENPLIENPSNTALSSILSTIAIKTSIVKLITKVKISGIAEESEIIETGAPFVAQMPQIRVTIEARQ